MAQHIYMSVGQQTKFNGPYIDTQTNQVTKVMRYRGEASDNDDPQGFKRVMAKRGHLVEIKNKRIGKKTSAGHYEYDMVDG